MRKAFLFPFSFSCAAVPGSAASCASFPDSSSSSTKRRPRPRRSCHAAELLHVRRSVCLLTFSAGGAAALLRRCCAVLSALCGRSNPSRHNPPVPNSAASCAPFSVSSSSTTKRRPRPRRSCLPPIYSASGAPSACSLSPLEVLPPCSGAVVPFCHPLPPPLFSPAQSRAQLGGLPCALPCLLQQHHKALPFPSAPPDLLHFRRLL